MAVAAAAAAAATSSSSSSSLSSPNSSPSSRISQNDQKGNFLPCTVQSLLALLEDSGLKVSGRKDSFHKLGLTTDSTRESLEDAQQYLKYIHSKKYEVHCDEVYPHLYLGGENAARSKHFLKALAITHVLNTAQGSGIGQVDIDENYYRSTRIKFMGLSLEDAEETDITSGLEEVSAFIDDAIDNGGKVLVHCVLGMSRSPSIVAAYLMYRRGMSATQALRTIRSRREIHPNSGFLQQLCDLDVRLRQSRRKRQASMPAVI